MRDSVIVSYGTVFLFTCAIVREFASRAEFAALRGAEEVTRSEACAVTLACGGCVVTVLASYAEAAFTLLLEGITNA